MYDFIDRPVASLDPGGRLLVWAVRHWVRGAGAGRCPCGDVAPAFHKRDLMHVFPHFHVMMAVFNRDALLKLRFGAPDCGRVHEHESLILTLVRDMHLAPVDQCRATAALIVRRDSVATLTIALSALAQGLAGAGLLPRLAAPDTRHARFADE